VAARRPPRVQAARWYHHSLGWLGDEAAQAPRRSPGPSSDLFSGVTFPFCFCGCFPACREAGTTLVAYSPLCQGLLTGKYSKDNRPSGPRAQLFTEERYRSVQVRCRGWRSCQRGADVGAGMLRAGPEPSHPDRAWSSLQTFPAVAPPTASCP
jgi:hypothetical protein